MEIITIGKGQFGSALAEVFRRCGFKIHFVETSSPWPDNLSKNFMVLICVPTQKIPDLVARRANDLKASPFILSTCKGLLQGSDLTPIEYLHEKLGPKQPLAVMSGPSFASEVKRGLPAALVLSCKNAKKSIQFSKLLSCGALRFYSNTDPRGVEYCGALKNVYAILAGICAGLGLGESARASLNTRALSELSRIVHAVGGRKLTVFGLAGAGDLFLTCSSPQSRNYQFGFGLAKGLRTEELLSRLGTVEGYWTAFVAEDIVRKKRVRAPLISTAAAILSNKLSIEEALKQLLSREIRGEFDQ